MQLLGSQFRPEFLNRIDEIIIFRGLGREQLREITGLMLEQTRRLHAQGVTLKITEGALDWLAGRPRLPARVRRPPAAAHHPAGTGQRAGRAAVVRAVQPRRDRHR